jgi:hypothetical protein
MKTADDLVPARLMDVVKQDDSEHQNNGGARMMISFDFILFVTEEIPSWLLHDAREGNNKRATIRLLLHRKSLATSRHTKRFSSHTSL